MSASMRNAVVPFLSGLVFAIGLVVGGMTQPAKVIGFLDIFGDWDPSLIFVMGGAIAVYLPVHQLFQRRALPGMTDERCLPNRGAIDRRLIAGAALFGVGWGLGGYCPGPGIVSLASGGARALVFVAGMAVGMVAFRLVDGRRSGRQLSDGPPRGDELPGNAAASEAR